ncbi:uncharacterized protein LOC110032121 [Phalaenopsis equestris]|uniref:uncharacterized protein LOC110032121 n=1 Tax=Phalaenopsis equestris TaxID=78828 RepID=UPI0009E1D474|nr:uncharacterized protein LOC110032121 [Phalaenopsis equestris]
MATPLPNPKLFSSRSLVHSRCPSLYSFYHFTLTTNSEKLVQASTISPRRRRQCAISFASRRRSRASSTSASIVSEDEEEDWEEDDEEEGKEFMPSREMTRWLQNKPAGFGEGLKYNTALEDKLLEEIKRNQKDQLEGNSKPRLSEKEIVGSVKKQEKQKVAEVIKTDPEVRVWNLPKKKNINRDLWRAFKGFPGIVSINPAVIGNRKTRDPICRGFAFIGFESDDAAYRFVQKYSKQNLVFGKIQKQISCDVINVHGVLNSPDSSTSTCSTSPVSKSTNGIKPNKEEFSVLPHDTNISLTNNENAINKDNQFNRAMLANQNLKKVAKRDKTKPPKSSKRHILGSLAKLKIKDRAVFTGAFSKYGEIASAASKEI